jgi:hypothetical protein
VSQRWTYRQDQELPSFAVTWKDRAGNIINFASGYTFQVLLVHSLTGTVALTKTANITGAATAPNVTVGWASGELNLAVGVYYLHLKANNGAGTDRMFSPKHLPELEITATPV